MDHAHHSHGSIQSGVIANLKIAFFLNLLFTLIEIAGGLWTHSMAIVADALHDLGDSLALGFAWYFQRLALKERDSRFSFGYRRFSLLSAVINSLVLIAGSIAVLRMVVIRLFQPQPADSLGMLALAILGILVNGFAVFRLRKGKTMNEKVVSLHLLEDVLGWGAVFIAAVVMQFTSFSILDPLLALGITAYILIRVFKNLKSGYRIFLQAVPDSIQLKSVESELEKIPGVKAVHDTHIWSLDGDVNVLSVHLVVDPETGLAECSRIKSEARSRLMKIHIQHSTIEIESSDELCQLQNCLDGTGH